LTAAAVDQAVTVISIPAERSLLTRLTLEMPGDERPTDTATSRFAGATANATEHRRLPVAWEASIP
jgi:hypothetical protein